MQVLKGVERKRKRTKKSEYPSIHQVPGLMALAIMSFQTSRSRAADIISVTPPSPNQDFRLSSIFSLCLPFLLFLSSLPVVRKCSKPSLLITWPKIFLFAFLSSAPMICWFLPPPIPSHFFSSLSMVYATFFSGTTILPLPISSDSACLSSMPQTRTSRSAGYSIEGLPVSS